MELAVTAGEVSGDIQAGRLISCLKRIMPSVYVWGMGGQNMRAAGADIVSDITELAVVGFWEAAKNYKRIKKVFNEIAGRIESARPDAVILVDYPGFNLRLAEKIKRLGIPVIYYISPQVWAWGRGRIKKIKNLVDKMIVIFPFEKEIYERHGVPVFFAGHPFIDIISERESGRSAFRKELGIREGERLIGILPGSRTQEVERHLPVFMDAAERIDRAMPVIGAASKTICELVKGCGAPVFTGRTYDIMEASDIVLTSSGTATVETACFGTPMVVIYKLNRFTYFFIKRMIGVRYIAMANIIAGRKIVPELVQSEANAENVAREARRILDSPGAARDALMDVKNKLGSPGAVRRAAEAVCAVIGD